MTDPYQVLGVNRSSTKDEIKKEYLLLVKKHHPDAGGNEEKMKAINQAWETLKDSHIPSSYQTSSRTNKTPSDTSKSNSYQRTQTTYTRTRTRRKPRTSYSYSNIDKNTFKKICICGCNGYPLTHLPEYSIDYGKYQNCPARWLRKDYGFYFDNQGQKISWGRRKRHTYNDPNRKKKSAETKKKKREEEKSKKEKEKASAEAYRIKNRLVPLSPAEARRRNLKYYKSKPCKYGHDSLRDLKSNCLKCREIENARLRSETLAKQQKDRTTQERTNP